MVYRLICGSCEHVLDWTVASDSIDSVVTDPPYGLTSERPGGRSEATRGAVMGGFMGLQWDSAVPDAAVWGEVLRVLKPGGYLLAFGGTRSYHRLTCAIEDAGFEIRDQVMWLYGSGFPKSHNLKGEREGWGTALKPAWEPIIVARKPLAGTVAENVRDHGTGALNIDECRVPGADTRRTKAGGSNDFPLEDDSWMPRSVEVGSSLGRWPANVIHDGSEEVLAAFPDAPGQMADASSSSRKTQHVYGAMRRGNGRDGEPSADSENVGVVGFKMKPGARRLDAGTAARFFYCAKASKLDRGAGNTHPTVKPTALMRYLCRLVTPPGGIVLDPFMGSGSTGKAALLEGFDFLGIDRESSYVAVAQARLATLMRPS